MDSRDGELSPLRLLQLLTSVWLNCGIFSFGVDSKSLLVIFMIASFLLALDCKLGTAEIGGQTTLVCHTSKSHRTASLEKEFSNVCQIHLHM